MKVSQIEQKYSDDTLNLCLDTVNIGKQALVFCNTKRGAESQAERVAVKIRDIHPDEKEVLNELSESVLSAVSSPTKQCKRLALCVKHGVAFHHAGLNAQQRQMVEIGFREGTLKIICATPTLAMGMDLPAYRSVIRDLKRFSSGTSWGMADIPVLEYEQMSGRAGRPGQEDSGQAICIASNESDRERIIEKYLLGEPEQIHSKLAVEPVLRTYVLSLVASGYVHDKESLYRFFDGTFYAWQYGDTEKLHAILNKMIGLLQGWGFIEKNSMEQDDFVVAIDVVSGSLVATKLGERVAQLYLDPLTANHLLVELETSTKRKIRLQSLPLLHLISTTLEIRPLFSIKKAEFDEVDEELVKWEGDLIVKPPTIYSYEYEDYLRAMKTAIVFNEWIEEAGEDIILQRFGVRPGELQAKRSIADWLLYSLIELAKLKGWQTMIAEFEKLRVRLEHGAKEELLTLLRLRNIGRVRARKLYRNGVRNLGDLKKAEYSKLAKLLGPKLAVNVKEQVGQKVRPEDVKVKENRRKGQINLNDYSTE